MEGVHHVSFLGRMTEQESNFESHGNKFVITGVMSWDTDGDFHIRIKTITIHPVEIAWI